jgi:hypothetical protein
MLKQGSMPQVFCKATMELLLWASFFAATAVMKTTSPQ